MADKPKPEDQKQTTKKGLEIPVPKKDDFLGNLKKVSKPER